MFVTESRLLHKYDTCRTAFLCCDIQEKLRTHIENYGDAVKVSNGMIKLHEMMESDKSIFLVTEHLPEKLGPTARDIALTPDAKVFSKCYPSMLTDDVRPYIIGDEARGIPPVQQVVLWGHETHVCVIHTADELLQRGIRVAVVVDGCAAQRKIDHDTSVLAMSSWPGLTLTTSQSVCMQLSRGEESMMKAILAILKDK